MFKKLIDKLQNLTEQAVFDINCFDDPLAQSTEWSPLRSGGSNFQTHRLKKVHAQRMEFRCSPGMWLFGGVFLLIGIGTLIGAGFAFLHRGANTEQAMLFFLPLFGLVFGGVGFYTLRSAMVPRVFDLSHGYYCRDRRKPEHSFDVSAIKDHIRLEQIHALQLISEHVTTSKSSYRSYELNLVLRDGSRIHVIDHGGRQALVRDAKTLSTFLDKPLWNAI